LESRKIGGGKLGLGGKKKPFYFFLFCGERGQQNEMLFAAGFFEMLLFILAVFFPKNYALCANQLKNCKIKELQKNVFDSYLIRCFQVFQKPRLS